MLAPILTILMALGWLVPDGGRGVCLGRWVSLFGMWKGQLDPQGEVAWRGGASWFCLYKRSLKGLLLTGEVGLEEGRLLFSSPSLCQSAGEIGDQAGECLCFLGGCHWGGAMLIERSPWFSQSERSLKGPLFSGVVGRGKAAPFLCLDGSAFPALWVRGVCQLERWETRQGNIYVSLVYGKSDSAPGLVSRCERVYLGLSGPSVSSGVSFSPGKLTKKRRSFAGEIHTFPGVSLPVIPSAANRCLYPVPQALSGGRGFPRPSSWPLPAGWEAYPVVPGHSCRCSGPWWEGRSSLAGSGDSPRKGMNWEWTVSAELTTTLSDGCDGADGCCQGNCRNCCWCYGRRAPQHTRPWCCRRDIPRFRWLLWDTPGSGGWFWRVYYDHILIRVCWRLFRDFHANLFGDDNVRLPTEYGEALLPHLHLIHLH